VKEATPIEFVPDVGKTDKTLVGFQTKKRMFLTTSFVAPYVGSDDKDAFVEGVATLMKEAVVAVPPANDKEGEHFVFWREVVCGDVWRKVDLLSDVDGVVV